MKQKQKPFVQMKVWEDKTTYKQAVKESENKIEVVKEALDWCSKHLDSSKIDKELFLVNMVVEFNRQVELQKGNIVKTKLAVEKLHFLLDIHISELIAMQREYERLSAKVFVEDNEFISGVSIEDFTRYTSNEQENEALIIANDFI